ncbi:L,D-transpeptidase family protein [Neptuniibacter sp. QD57_21]|uniref:L,D-transpeptidase family protein n=1 Tax=Neptuniibacter sp. QD57_21 TaxID=3398213 RepID=UPI0039F4AACC
MLCIRVSIARQTLELSSGNRLLQSYSISTALNGPGEQKNSGCTPRGRHYIRAMIGSDAPENAVFIGRRQTGEIYSQELAEAYPNRDWILTRIMWLSGLEIGRNRLGQVDTMQRYVYIHGTPDTEPMGVAKSHGCIRMRNSDLIELFSKVSAGTSVLIEE